METLDLTKLAKLGSVKLQKKLDNGEFKRTQRPTIEELIAAVKEEETKLPAQIVTTQELTKRNAPGETTFTRDSFTDDTKGLRAGDRVEFPGKTGKIIQGKLQRIFGFFAKEREEGKIFGDDGGRYYKFLKDINHVKVVEPVKEPEVAETEGAGI